MLPDGEVIGVVFSRSTTNNDIGYALTSPGVLAEVRKEDEREERKQGRWWRRRR